MNPVARFAAGLLLLVAVAVVATPANADRYVKSIDEQSSGMDSRVMHTRRDELAAAVRKSLQAELDADDKGGTTTVVVPANMQTAPLINIGK